MRCQEFHSNTFVFNSTQQLRLLSEVSQVKWSGVCRPSRSTNALQTWREVDNMNEFVMNEICHLPSCSRLSVFFFVLFEVVSRTRELKPPKRHKKKRWKTIQENVSLTLFYVSELETRWGWGKEKISHTKNLFTLTNKPREVSWRSKERREEKRRKKRSKKLGGKMIISHNF